MKQTKTMVMIFCVVLCAGIVGSALAVGAQPVAIKGFYIGMSIDDALKNFQRLGFDGLTVRENQYRKQNTYYTISPGSGDPFKVSTGFNDKAVTLISFSSGISDRLFHTDGIDSEIFKQHFMDAYHLEEMMPYGDNPGSDAIRGWEHYNLDDGYRIRIDVNKAVEMIKTARESEFSFD